MVLQLPASRADRPAVQIHMRLGGRAAAFSEVAGRAGGGDILPGRAPALGARDDVVEGQFPRVAAILAGELVAEEQVEPGEGRIFGGLHILPERDDARDRSEERRVGKECVSTCRSRGSPYHYKKKNNKRNK